MPLHDHFHSAWSVQRPWEGFHSAWATAIAFHLNSGVLPADYFALPLVQVSGRVEVDVATFQEAEKKDGAGTATAVWAPPQPTLTVPFEGAETDAYEVQILRNFGGPQLRAAIELVSPSNKDRPASRQAFATKCAAYLQRAVSVVIIDMVTERAANLHAEVITLLQGNGQPAWQSPTGLYAVAYRAALVAGQPHLQAWPEVLAISSSLPELPLWLEPDLCVPLRLEESYTVTCGSLRMPG
jgi:hypothetical protein